jgi:hypothetical protein
MPKFTATRAKIRKDVGVLFSKSDLLSSSELTHTPFLVFRKKGVEIISKVTELLLLKGNPTILVQWQGKWRSDFFTFKLKELRDWLKEHPDRAAHIGTSEFHLVKSLRT